MNSASCGKVAGTLQCVSQKYLIKECVFDPRYLRIAKCGRTADTSGVISGREILLLRGFCAFITGSLPFVEYSARDIAMNQFAWAPEW
jgi:hypothetical protein